MHYVSHFWNCWKYCRSFFTLHLRNWIGFCPPIFQKIKVLINGILPTISVNKRCHSHQGLQPQPMVSYWALRTLGMWKHRILASDNWGAYQRNDFSEPRLLHLPIQGKVLNSLTWDIWFSLMKSNLLTSRLPRLCCKTSGAIRPGFPPPPQSSSFSVTWDVPSFEVLKIPAE